MNILKNYLINSSLKHKPSYKSQIQAKLLMYDYPFLEYYTANDCNLVLLQKLERYPFNLVTYYQERVSGEFIREVDKAIINTTLFYDQKEEVRRLSLIHI
eukprot:TRINITY_DN24912_c0_g1_i1.p1 TRINITY_DN24912_c0_g1~~TRINITY_DN24912_c0_g1_i1.p1  ORF type:complete len:100 (+),score=9.30 TRINITY_DN24912_c0_g1_i1:98-397(+)